MLASCGSYAGSVRLPRLTGRWRAQAAAQRECQIAASVRKGTRDPVEPGQLIHNYMT